MSEEKVIHVRLKINTDGTVEIDERFVNEDVITFYGYPFEELLLVVKMLQENNITPEMIKYSSMMYSKGYNKAIEQFEESKKAFYEKLTKKGFEY